MSAERERHPEDGPAPADRFTCGAYVGDDEEGYCEIAVRAISSPRSLDRDGADLEAAVFNDGDYEGPDWRRLTLAVRYEGREPQEKDITLHVGDVARFARTLNRAVVRARRIGLLP